jgi:tetratricopeptide (TPR) repeat protein
MDKFAARNFKGAVKFLEDYVNRYPGTPEAIDARYHLAQSYLFSNRPAAAIPMFLSVIEIRGKSALGNEARTYLGQAYLDASKFTEAYLVSDELLDQPELGATFRAKALLIRAHAQAGLGQTLEAEKTLVAFQAIAESDPELERETANSFLVSLLLKSNRCDALPSAKALPEDQVLDQIARKGICVLEMGTLLVRAAKRLGGDAIAQAADTLVTSLRTYRRACENPPLTSKHLSKKKFAIAKKELKEKLREGCQNAEKLLVETFRGHENLKSVITKIQSREMEHD